MNIAELAHVFEGLTIGLAAGMKEKDRRELESLGHLFQRFPNQSVSQFVQFVESAISREVNTIPSLVERMNVCKSGGPESAGALIAILDGLSANDLKQIVTALGLRPLSKKPDNLRLLRDYLVGESSPIMNDAPSRTTSEIEAAFLTYQQIQNDLRSIEIEEMRQRIAPFANMSKAVLAGVVRKVGYIADGNKNDLYMKLVDNLQSVKRSLDQTQQIAS